MASVADLDALEAQLRAILEPYGDELEAAEIYTIAYTLSLHDALPI